MSEIQKNIKELQKKLSEEEAKRISLSALLAGESKLMQPDTVPSGVSRSKEYEHNAKHVLYGVKLHLEKNILILTNDWTQEDGAAITT